MSPVETTMLASTAEHTTHDIREAVAAIRAKRDSVAPWRSVLIGVTGIDASGKGYLTQKIITRLREQDVKAIHINVDGWLNLPHRRFNPDNPAQHFYVHAIRFDEMFQQLILPLKENRRICLVADFAEETATEYRKHTYQFQDVDVIVLEGIFLLKPAFRRHFDLSIWVDCTFETALERALQRAQEGLPAAETIRAYQTIYFPAQKIHMARHNPRGAADLIIHNDPRIEGWRTGPAVWGNNAE